MPGTRAVIPARAPAQGADIEMLIEPRAPDRTGPLLEQGGRVHVQSGLLP